MPTLGSVVVVSLLDGEDGSQVVDGWCAGEGLSSSASTDDRDATFASAVPLRERRLRVSATLRVMADMLDTASARPRHETGR